MIQAEELRIGNKLLMEFENVDETVNSRMIGFIAIANRTQKPHPFVGILIREEILLKCGFDEYSDELTIKLGHRYFLCYSKTTKRIFTENTDLDDDGAVYHEHIKYLHQLQNLYFALTGKELEIKL